MFSVSLNLPQNESAPVEYFEKALADIERDLGLEGQPRAVVFHEKEGRRHAHCVWSRINTEEMKAINLPYYKLKLQDISKQLYFQYGWQMPRGLIDRQLKERQVLQKEILQIRNDRKLEILNLRQDTARYIEMSGKSQKSIHEKLNQVEKQQKRTREKDKDQDYEPEI